MAHLRIAQTGLADMTAHDLAAIQRKLPLSAACLKRNQARDTPSSAQPEQAVRHEPLAEAPRAGRDARRIAVRVTSYRRRLLDPDNLCPKYFVDGLRYALLIPDDSEEDISLEVRQVQVCRKENERTEIEIT